MSDWATLAEELKAEAIRRGWAAVGVSGMEPLPAARRRGIDAVRAGRMASMSWMSEERMRSATDLGSRYPWGRSILALAWPYRPAAPRAADPVSAPRGRMAAYACLEGEGGVADYHEHLGARCDELVDWLVQRAGPVRAKRFVDHGWAMDRAIAEHAGVGFVGKHASLLTAGAGSYVLLAEVVLSLPLPPDRPSPKGCGSCQACLPACPTGAIVAPGVIDARRCISYLTIEHTGEIPTALRPLMGTWVFGCDLCQEACPINHRKAPVALAESPSSPRHGPVPHPDLIELLQLDDTAFAGRFAGTVVQRTGRASIARNAAIALGNAGDPRAIPALLVSIERDPDPVVREAARWAADRLLLEEPEGGPGADGDRSAHAGGDQWGGVALGRPPGMGDGTPNRHA